MVTVENFEPFGTLLRTMRESRGRTRPEVALASVGTDRPFSVSYMQQWEEGRADPPSPGVVLVIARILKAPAQPLLQASIRLRECVELETTPDAVSTAALLAEVWPALDDAGREVLRDALAKVRGRA